MEETSLDLKLINEIKSLANILNRKLTDAIETLGDEEITGFQLWILFYIYYHQRVNSEVYQKDIEQYFDIRRPTASKLLAALEELGYLERQRDIEDQRRKMLILSEKAKAVVLTKEESTKDFMSNLVYGFTSSELKLFLSSINDLKKNLQKSSYHRKRLR